MKNLYLLIFIAFCSCSNPRTDQIIVPKLESNFYSKALVRINEELKSNPDDQKLVDQKIFYCQQLDWPTTCIAALDSYRIHNGMTNQLVEQYISYYLRHERYQLLVNIIEKWSEEYDLKDRFHQPFIASLVKLGKKERALTELRAYMFDKSALIDFEFASKQYLHLKDTLMATYYLSKIFKLDSDNELMIDYGRLLISLNHTDHGFEILDKNVPVMNNDKSFNLNLARLYAQHSKFVMARKLVQPYVIEDTVSYLISYWYEKELKWDSAVITMDVLLNEDSLNTRAIWRKARIYENRGYLITSLEHYRSILMIQPEDTITSNRIDLIQRKIAYLQRKKFEENKIQIKEIEPIKINQ